MFAQTISQAVRVELERVAAHIAGRDDAWSIPPATGEFLHSLILAAGFTRGLELGTSYGYSGLWIGSALLHNHGMLHTLERNEAKIEFSRTAFRRAGFGDRVRVVGGIAAETLAQLDGPFDFVFIDADKENSRRYFDLVWPHLAMRGTIVTDNVNTHPQELAEYLAYLRSHAQFSSAPVQIGSGLEISVKTSYRPAAGIDGADWVI